MMNVLVFGSDSCTHAFAWKLINSPSVEQVIAAPGNAGTSFFAPSTRLAVDDHTQVTNFVLSESIDLVVSDAQGIASGLTDELIALPVPVFGASRALDSLQKSRCATREWLQQHNLPVPRGRVCTTQAQAERYAATLAHPLIVLADAPDGPIITCPDRATIPRAIADCLTGQAGGVVIQEQVVGPLVTASLLTDGHTAFPVPTTRRYAATAQINAPTTGVLSAATPVWNRLEGFLQQHIRNPLLAAFQADQHVTRGWLGTTCSLGARGPVVQLLHLVPSGSEAVAVLLRLEDDFLPLLMGCARGTLAQVNAPRWRSDAAIGVVLQPGGMSQFRTHISPTAFETFDPGVLVFHQDTEPGLLNTYVPRSGRYGNPNQHPWPDLSLIGSISHAPTNDSLIAIVATAAPDVAAARERVYRNLRNSLIPEAAYAQDIGVREM